MPNFEKYSKDLVPLKRDPWVTLQKRGAISLNQSAFVLLERPAAVELLYDADGMIIGLRKADVHGRDVHFVRSPSGKEAGPFVISAIAFLKYYEINLDSSYRWPAYLDDGTLCIDLGRPGTVVTSNRAK